MNNFTKYEKSIIYLALMNELKKLEKIRDSNSGLIYVNATIRDIKSIMDKC